MELRIRSRRVVTPHGVVPATVVARDGVITDVVPYEGPEEARDIGDLVLLPGLVDSHVHVNEPGRTEWEGFRTATRAAAAGGVTTIVDMPLNSIPPTLDEGALDAKLRAAEGRCAVDVALWGGVVPGNAGQLRALRARGVPGFKCFLVPSGVDEFPHVEEADLREALPIVAASGAVLLAHAELGGPIEEAARRAPPGSPCCYASWLASRPPEAELRAVELLVRLCRETGARVHIVHLANGDAIETLARARAEGLPLSAETCPHYLFFDGSAIPDRATAFKCAPPIRERVHREALWAGLADRVIDLVATDHSPCPPAMKLPAEGDFLRAWGGIGSLELGLCAVWSAAQGRGIGVERLAGWMSGAPARLAGLAGRKGAIAPGLDADLVVFDPDASVMVGMTPLHQRHPITPYDGEMLVGAVRATYLRGRLIYEDGVHVDPPSGRLLTGGPS
jgi:allantoinase